MAESMTNKSGRETRKKPTRIVTAKTGRGKQPDVDSRADAAGPQSVGSVGANRCRIFLLSPANAAGLRAKFVTSERATFDLAARLRNGGAPLGEVFSFISGLYFRGKLAYARAFSRAPKGISGAYVITACGGLIPEETMITLEQLAAISAASIDCRDKRYRVPLERDAQILAGALPKRAEVVLLGSVATSKYVEPLLGIFGQRLMFPAEFAGRGDMSRGGLMLRCARAGVQLTYVPVATAVRHGPRPPKLPKLPRYQ
jgi:hypothetical protein